MTRCRVFDSFLFCDELDLLECRLTELDSAVYRFVIVESAVTFQGNPKSLYFLENQDRFSPWRDKIIYVQVNLDGYDDPWSREHTSRDAIVAGLSELRDDDIFMLSDVDEIPFPDVIQDSPTNILMMRQHSLAANLAESYLWAGTIVANGSEHRQVIWKFRDRQKGDNRPVRTNEMGFPIISGWHFPWLGGPDEMKVKASSFSHSEVSDDIDQNAERMYKERISPSSGSHLMETIIDESWPRYMQERRGPASWYWPGDGS